MALQQDLFAGWAAAMHLMAAREDRMAMLGRKLEVERRDGEAYFHYDDDPDRRAVERAWVDRALASRRSAARDARRLAAAFGIPFASYDPVIRAAEAELQNIQRVVCGAADADPVYCYSETTRRLVDLADSTTPDTSHQAQPQMPRGGGPSSSRQAAPVRKGIPLAEAEVRVREWLTANAKGNPGSITRDAVAAGTGVSRGAVSKTAAWRAFRDRRDAGAKTRAREVPLTDEMLAVLPGDTETPEVLSALIEEQKTTMAEDRGRHSRRHQAS